MQEEDEDFLMGHDTLGHSPAKGSENQAGELWRFRAGGLAPRRAAADGQGSGLQLALCVSAVSALNTLSHGLHPAGLGCCKAP